MKGIGSDQRIFPISYTAGREVVNKAGKVVGIHLKPHDLRRHAATYASRSGVPIEIVSKVILRHANLSTTQRYLGTVSDVEALRWINHPIFTDKASWAKKYYLLYYMTSCNWLSHGNE